MNDHGGRFGTRPLKTIFIYLFIYLFYNLHPERVTQYKTKNTVKQ